MKGRKACCLGRIFETADITGKLVVESLIAIVVIVVINYYCFVKKMKTLPQNYHSLVM